MFIFVERIGARDGFAKTKQGGTKFIKKSSVRIEIHNILIAGWITKQISTVVDWFKLRL